MYLVKRSPYLNANIKNLSVDIDIRLTFFSFPFYNSPLSLGTVIRLINRFRLVSYVYRDLLNLLKLKFE